MLYDLSHLATDGCESFGRRVSAWKWQGAGDNFSFLLLQGQGRGQQEAEGDPGRQGESSLWIWTRVLRTLLFTCSWHPDSLRLPLLQLEFQTQWFVKQAEQMMLVMRVGGGKTGLQ